VLDRPIDWGDDFYKGIEPNEEWKHNVMMARMLMSENLCICSHATLQLMRLWQDFENNLFVGLPQPREKAVVLAQFIEQQDAQMARVKNLLSSEWNKAAVDILREELENLDKDQTATFFESVATLMANQVRQLIKKSVDAYVEFFRRFRKSDYPTPKEIMTREFDADTEFEDNFLILKLAVNNTNQVVFTDLPASVSETLEGLVSTIVRQSEHIPRPENTIARSEKLHLWHVPEDDELVTTAKKEISEILESNMTIVEKALHVYDEYLFILKEKTKVETFLSNPDSFKREEFGAEISRYQETQKKIRDTMPKELRMNMFMIDCSELNNKLCQECDALILMIVKRAIDFVLVDSSMQIQQRVKQVVDMCQSRANDSTQVLVASEKEFEDFKLFKRQEIINQYTDLVDWLCFLYDNRHINLEDEQTRSITQCHTQILRIAGLIETKERTLRQDRDEIENKVVLKKKIFQENLDKIKHELERFREYNAKRNEEEYNKQIANIIQELANLTQEMREINDMEVDLDQPPTEYPEIDKYKIDIKPFEELWKIVHEQSTKYTQWTEGPLLQLDPEEVEKDHKTIWQTA